MNTITFQGLQFNRWASIKNLSDLGRIELDSAGRPTRRWEGRTLLRISLPFAVRPALAPETLMRHLYANRRCYNSLNRCLSEVDRLFGPEERKAAGLDILLGSYIPANGVLPLTTAMAHAYGLAIRFGGLPDVAREIFEAEGWRAMEETKKNATMVAASA